MDLTRRQILATLLAAPLGAAVGRLAGAELLTKEQESRLKKFLPRTFGKLQRRDPVFVAVCGDEISASSEPATAALRAGSVTSWPGRFLDRIGGPFFYHGGVTDLNPPQDTAGAGLAEQWTEYKRLRALWEAKRNGAPPPLPGVPPEDADGPQRLLSVNDLLRLSLPQDRQAPARSAFFLANYSMDGAVAVQVFDPLLSQVFHTEEKNATDLVVIAYGARDALEGDSLTAFRTVLEQAVAVCRQHGADVILAGPPPALDEVDERSALGRARPWAAVMREVADAAGVFFADLGAAAFHQPSDLLNRTVESTFGAALEPVKRMFDHGKAMQDGLHPNAAGHLKMGETAAAWLTDGEPARPFEISGELDTATGAENEAVLIIRAARVTKEELTISLSPLRFTGWKVKPGTRDRVHTFDPKRGAHLFKFPVLRTPEAAAAEEFVRGSAIVSDDAAQHLADVKVKVLPLVFLWPEERADGAGGDHLSKCTLVNTSRDALDASLTLDWQGKQTALPGVKVAAGARQSVAVRLPLPPVEAAFRLKETASVRVAVAGKTWKFERRVEGVRHIGLGQRLPLVPLSRWRGKPGAADAGAAGAHVTVQADVTRIYFLIDVPADTISDQVNDKPWGRLEVQMDGRKAGENGTLGCVGNLAVELPRSDGEGRILPVRPGVFGNGYDFQYMPGSFRAVVKTGVDGGRRIEFRVWRVNLRHHDWSLDGAGQSALGINVRLLLCDANAGGYSAAKTFVLSASGFPAADARSLTLLELRKEPAARWSLRIG